MGVRTSPQRLRQLSAGAPAADDELANLNFAWIATRIAGESRVSVRRRRYSAGARSLIFVGLVLVALNFLICTAYLMLSLTEQLPPP